MEVVDKLSEDVAEALDSRADALRAAGAAGPEVARGLAAARLTAALTDDLPLAVGVMLHEARHGFVAHGHDAHGRDERSLEAAAELGRLGEFGGAARWSGDGGLQGDQAEVLRKMLLAIVADPRLVVARMAIQLARLRGARDAPTEERRRLAQEARAVFAPLANRLGVWQVKWELEDLAFRHLEPQEYKRIAAALAERRADRERYITDLCADLHASLAAAGIDAEVQGRAKHIYSIHRKMQRKGLDFGRLSDIRAVRVVVGLSLIHI